MMLDGTNHVDAHPRDVFLENIPNHIHIEPAAFLPLLQRRKKGCGGQEDIFDIGENDRERLFIQHVEHRRVKDLHHCG